MNWTEICDYCILVMRKASDIYGVSYGFINVLWFIILQPLAILAMFIAYILQRMKKDKAALACCIAGIAMVAFIIVCLLITFLKMK